MLQGRGGLCYPLEEAFPLSGILCEEDVSSPRLSTFRVNFSWDCGWANAVTHCGVKCLALVGGGSSHFVPCPCSLSFQHLLPFWYYRMLQLLSYFLHLNTAFLQKPWFFVLESIRHSSLGVHCFQTPLVDSARLYMCVYTHV